MRPFIQSSGKSTRRAGICLRFTMYHKDDCSPLKLTVILGNNYCSTGGHLCKSRHSKSAENEGTGTKME